MHSGAIWQDLYAMLLYNLAAAFWPVRAI